MNLVVWQISCKNLKLGGVVCVCVCVCVCVYNVLIKQE
jgi:hypothetical protein